MELLHIFRYIIFITCTHLYEKIIIYKYYFYLQDYNAILPQLQNSAVHLKNINSDYINLYFETLLDAKERKTQAAMNRVRKNLTVLIF